MTATQEYEAVLNQIADKVRNLIAVHYESIRDIADQPDDKDQTGNVKFALSVELSFRGKTPAGAVNISIPPRTIKDGATFEVEDADQEKLPLDDTTLTIATEGMEPVTVSGKEFSKLPEKIRKMKGKK